MLPKLQRRSLIGFNDRSKSVMYYNPEMRKVLTSCNFHFLNPTRNPTLPEEIEVNPNTLCEGELGTGMQNARAQGKEGSTQEAAVRRKSVEIENQPDKEPPGPHTNLKRKRGNSVTVEEGKDSPHRTKGKCINYCHLHDPFSNNEDNEKIINITVVVSDETFSVATNDGEPTLKEAK
jgi:hypothetical protein